MKFWPGGWTDPETGVDVPVKEDCEDMFKDCP